MMSGFRQGHDRIIAQPPGAAPNLADTALAQTSEGTGEFWPESDSAHLQRLREGGGSQPARC